MKRKIIKIDLELYQVLKPLKEIKGWEKLGKSYTCKGLMNLLEVKRGIEFIISKDIEEEINLYRELSITNKKSYIHTRSRIKMRKDTSERRLKI